ncbi:cell wall-active antibiotics response protein [Myxococcota bacterium]|nr:cell wall-active antibiotics response protein [Myxococcota bacterium]MBU1411843.1 cell wall-active antibiotics response protein [Myxococcota bacterium]MBU1508796.1 cell wall-active antibiotics response protein [Myxococcota bacterium]
MFHTMHDNDDNHENHDDNGNHEKSTFTTTCVMNSSGDERCGGVFMGGAFILAGTAFLIEHLGYLPDGIASAWSLWPALLIWGGVVNFLLLGRGGHIGWGVGLLAAGALLGADKLGYVELQWGLLWPALIIAAGLAIVWGTFFSSKKHHKKDGQRIEAGRFETNIVMGGREDTVTSREFEGGAISCVMGSLELDLRDAEIRGEEAVLDVKVIMSGVQLLVPPHWEIVSRCSPVLGEIENKARKAAVPRQDGRPVKRLVIQGTIIMGGMEIRL